MAAISRRRFSNVFRLLVHPQNCADYKIKQRKLATRLGEVGILETPKLQGRYDTGQLFLHKVFGYRSIVLFPWVARVYDRDLGSKPETSTTRTYDDGPIVQGRELNYTGTSSRAVKGSTHTYYQVLIDSRDCPYIRAQTEAVTFLGNQENSQSLYAIPGLDYVAHEDILPYTSTEKQPIDHDLFDRFLIGDSGRVPPFLARETLRAWQEKNYPWLELSNVHRQTTENIRVTVMPFYMGSRESQGTHVYWWRYCIRLENLSDDTLQLRERCWRIFSLSGTMETIRGRGVIGQEPVLSKTQPAFQYSSHVSLQAPSGHMCGTFKMERQNGETFECKIPPFSLESKQDDTGSPPGIVGGN
ncbi:polymerase delta-interacting protein 2-like isoform X2 [Lineus longissimus]|uniref:polymerase delta-interacting protein 2-like isoform X2 n=1 Tax=Lineus longissimus TaxID=88925 RepID=UPI00315D825F